MFNIKFNEVSKMFPSWFSNNIRKFNKLGGILGYIPIDVVNEFKSKFNKENMTNNIKIIVKMIVKGAYEIWNNRNDE